jgi:hypothetical protein
MSKPSYSRSLAIVALALLLVWSAVMTALGHVAAVSTLVPSLALVVQQVVQAVTGGQAARPASSPGDPGAALAGDGPVGEER